ncbi:MAG: hypothetical protein QW404_02060 [Candidatus Nanoarchaeia archaeon]
MAEKEKIWVTPPMPGGIKVRHVGYLDLGAFYTWLQRWFEFEGYFTPELENFYEQKIETGGKRIEIRWIGKKKKNPYYTYVIEVIFLLININKVEVQAGEKKIRLEKGDFEIRFGAYVEKGMEGANFLRKLYENIIAKKQVELYKQECYDKVYKLQEEVKAYFNQYVQ